MFNPDYSLFKLQDNGVSFHPNPNSYISGPDHVQYFKFIGRMIGKAISEGQYMDCYFSQPFYKIMLGEDLVFEDFEDMDKNYYDSLKYYVTSDISSECLYFSVEREFFGR